MGTSASTQRGGQAVGTLQLSKHSAAGSAGVTHASPNQLPGAEYIDEHTVAQMMEQVRIIEEELTCTTTATAAPINRAESQLTEALLVHTAATVTISKPQALANNTAILNQQQQRGGNQSGDSVNKKNTGAVAVAAETKSDKQSAAAVAVPTTAAAPAASATKFNENDAGSQNYAAAAPTAASASTASTASSRPSIPIRPLPRQASATTMYRTHAIHQSGPAAGKQAKAGVFREPGGGSNANNVVLIPAANVSKLESIPPPPVARANSVTEAPAASAVPAADALPPPCMASSVVVSAPASASSRLASPPKRSAFARSFLAHRELTLSAERSDIVHYLQDREITLAVAPDYMRLQPELNYRMREILIDWLQGVSYRFRLKAESIMLCVNILDRFLCARECARDRFQLVGITCLILAAKYEESAPPSIEDFLIITDRAFERRAVLHMESVILSALSFELTLPCIKNFTGNLEVLVPLDALVESIRSHPSQAGLSGTRDIEGEFRNWVAYFSLACLQHAAFLSYSPSMIAGAAVALAHFQIQVEAAVLSGGVAAEADQGLPYWDAALRDASGGYDVGEFADVWAELRLILDPSCFVPGEARYESVNKRFQREAHHAVATKRIVFPKSM